MPASDDDASAIVTLIRAAHRGTARPSRVLGNVLHATSSKQPSTPRLTRARAPMPPGITGLVRPSLGYKKGGQRVSKVSDWENALRRLWRSHATFEFHFKRP